MRAVSGTDMRLGVIEVELAELHDLLKEGGVLGIEQRRGVAILETILVGHVGRGVGRRNIAVGLRGRSAMASEGGHVAPLVRLSICGAGV